MANTTSGTTTFDKTYAIDDIIMDAYERIGLVGSSGNQIRSARRSLNILFQEWGNRGLHYWEVGTTNVTLVEGQAEYTFYRATGDGTSAPCVDDTNTADTSIYGFADISQCSFRQYNNSSGGTQADTTMTKIDRSTYAGYGDKKTKSTPSNFWVQRFIDKVTMTLYQTPDSSAAGNYVYINFVKRITDAGAYDNVGDIPNRFVPCMVSGLAYYLAQKWALDRVQQLKLLYEDELSRALAEDGSPTSAFISPKTYYPTAS